MRRLLVLAVASALLGAGFAQASPKAPTVAGFWEQSDDAGEVGAWFLFEDHEGVFDGRLVKTFRKPGDAGNDLCDKCKGDQKNARMLGLTIISGMKRDGLNYKDGSILDPRDGNVYHAEMSLSPDGQKLSVRGYLAVPLLGKTQVWKRLPDDAIAASEVPEEVLAAPAKP